MAAAGVSLNYGLGSDETLRWSATDCTGSGQLPNGITWQYSGSKGGEVRLRVVWDDTFPEIPEGKYWKSDECYEAITHLSLSGCYVGNRAFTNLKQLTNVYSSCPVVTVGDYTFAGSRIPESDFFYTLEGVGAGCFKNSEFVDMKMFYAYHGADFGASAFEESTLESVSFPDSIFPSSDPKIEKAVFKNCKSLHTVETHTDIFEYSESVFEGCSSLVTLWASSSPFRSTEVIGPRAFYGCSNLAMNVTSDRTIAVIGESAFEGSGIISADLFKNNRTIFTMGAAAFKDCKDLERIELPYRLKTLPDSIFEGSGVSEVVIPESVTEFGEACFRNCKSLTTVTYLGHAKAPSSVFEGCDALTNVTLADDYEYDTFGGYRVRGLPLGAKIGIGIGVVAFVIIVVAAVVVFLFLTGRIGGGKRDNESVDA